MAKPNIAIIASPKPEDIKMDDPNLSIDDLYNREKAANEIYRFSHGMEFYPRPEKRDWMSEKIYKELLDRYDSLLGKYTLSRLTNKDKGRILKILNEDPEDIAGHFVRFMDEVKQEKHPIYIKPGEKRRLGAFKRINEKKTQLKPDELEAQQNMGVYDFGGLEPSLPSFFLKKD